MEQVIFFPHRCKRENKEIRFKDVILFNNEIFAFYSRRSIHGSCMNVMCEYVIGDGVTKLKDLPILGKIKMGILIDKPRKIIRNKYLCNIPGIGEVVMIDSNHGIPDKRFTRYKEL